MVVRALLSLKMTNSYAFAEDAGKLLNSYLSDQSQFVRTADGDSETRETECDFHFLGLLMNKLHD
jgi:hypothetical protein